MPITIHDVAQRLGLSVTTVSRALAGYDDVARATRERVIRVADEMGYLPSHAARQLRTQKTETIGLVFPTTGARFSDPFFGEFMAGLGDEASRLSYDLLVSVAAPGEEEQRTYRRMVQSRRVDGFALVRMRVDDWRIQYLAHTDLPFVSFGRSRTPADFHFIGVDGHWGMRQLVRHLASQGCDRIAFIGAPEDLTLTRDRLEGYRTGLQEAGLSIFEELIVEGDLTRVGGYQAAQQLLDLKPAPHAIIGINDLTALGAVRSAHERKLKIGTDLLIAGFDGTEASEHSLPPLTTLSQPVYEIGRRLGSTLVALIQGTNSREPEQIIRPTLVIRQSTTGKREMETPSHAEAMAALGD